MEFFSLVNGKKLPEVYHLSFSGTHFQIFLNFAYWSYFVELAGNGTYNSLGQGQAYVSPDVFGGGFGQHSCANASKTLDGSVCISVPAFLEKNDDENKIITMRVLGQTLSSILFILQHLLYEIEEQNEELVQGGQQQLFVLETAVARESGFHSAGLGLSLSPLARKYLEGLGKNITIGKAGEAMGEHYRQMNSGDEETVLLFRHEFEVRLREHGVLGMRTAGNCACLGTMPQNFGDMGCYLSSHNVDAVAQQFSLLVGIAHVWQLVRNGLPVKV